MEEERRRREIKIQFSCPNRTCVSEMWSKIHCKVCYVFVGLAPVVMGFMLTSKVQSGKTKVAMPGYYDNWATLYVFDLTNQAVNYLWCFIIATICVYLKSLWTHVSILGVTSLPVFICSCRSAQNGDLFGRVTLMKTQKNKQSTKIKKTDLKVGRTTQLFIWHNLTCPKAFSIL